MDITPQDDTTSTQPISDDQDLAKALAGIDDTEETPAPAAITTSATDTTQFEEAVPVVPDIAVTPEPVAPVAPTEPVAVPEPVAAPAAMPVTAPVGDLDGIKQAALTELRPLIDRVELPAEEKFDTYLMLIRSTDDTSLIAPAHAAAQAITDEKKKAEALLDIVKEIDFLAHPQA